MPLLRGAGSSGGVATPGSADPSPHEVCEMRGLTKLGPEPEASLRDGGIMRFSDHHVERTKAVFGSDLVGEWSARQQAGQGQLLVARDGERRTMDQDVGLGW